MESTIPAKNKFRILMFAPVFVPAGNPEAIVNGKLALAFINAGFHIDIITRAPLSASSYDYGSTWEDPWLRLKERTHSLDYRIDNKLSQAISVFKAALRMRHFITGCNWSNHAVNYALDLHNKNKYHIILSRSIPDFGHLPALYLSEKLKVPWIANWNDLWGEINPPPAGKGLGAGLGFAHDRFLRKVAEKASCLTFPSERMKNYMCQYLGMEPNLKAATIPHVAMKIEPNFTPIKNKVFTLCYAGNLYATREPDVFLQGLKMSLENNTENLKLRVLIMGLEDVGLSEKIKEYGLETIIQFKGRVSYEDSLKIMQQSDVTIVIEAPYENGIYLPSKFVDYVQVGRPILAVSPVNGALNDIISKYGGGIAVDCRSVNEIKEAIEKMYLLWLDNKLDEVYGSMRLYKLFSPETIVEKYNAIFQRFGVGGGQSGY
jgi:glycosyltransferase involved in cell wall biosynthesis